MAEREDPAKQANAGALAPAVRVTSAASEAGALPCVSGQRKAEIRETQAEDHAAHDGSIPHDPFGAARVTTAKTD